MVVAIIAVLTGIVLVNVVPYLNKGKDAAIRANLGTILTNSAVYLDSNGTYTGFCSTPYWTDPSDAILGANGGSAGVDVWCNADAVSMCACASLTETPGQVFCVDSRGVKKVASIGCTSECDTVTPFVCR